MSDKPIRIVTVAGSVRPGNFTGKALRLVTDEIAQNDRASADLVDLTRYELKLPGLSDPEDAGVKEIQQRFAQATGIVLATPEYHGSFSSVMKLLIDNLGFPSVLSGKPVALLGVAAGQIGAIKALEHLRSVCSHVGAIVLPGPVSVAGVQRMFDEEGKCLDPALEKRIRGLAKVLVDYIEGAICPRVALEEAVREKKGE